MSFFFFFLALVRCTVLVRMGTPPEWMHPLRLVRFFSFVGGSIRPLILEALRGRHPGVGQEPYIVAQTLLLALVSVCVCVCGRVSEGEVARSQFTRPDSGTRQLAPISGNSDLFYEPPHPAEFFFLSLSLFLCALTWDWRNLVSFRFVRDRPRLVNEHIGLPIS